MNTTTVAMDNLNLHISKEFSKVDIYVEIACECLETANYMSTSGIESSEPTAHAYAIIVPVVPYSVVPSFTGSPC